MIAGRGYTLLGSTVEVTAPEPIAGHLAALLSSLPASGDPGLRLSIIAGDGGYRLTGNGTEASGDMDAVVEATLAVVNRYAVMNCRHLAVHAGVVGSAQGAVAFPAGSGGGKSTLTAACVLAGFAYLSDEALVLDGTGRVVPYPKPIALSPWSRSVLGLVHVAAASGSRRGEMSLAPAAMGGEVGRAGLPLREVVLVERAVVPASLEPLAPSEAVTALLRYSFNAYRVPAESYRLTTAAATDCRVWRLAYGEPRAAAILLRERLF